MNFIKSILLFIIIVNFYQPDILRIGQIFFDDILILIFSFGFFIYIIKYNVHIKGIYKKVINIKLIFILMLLMLIQTSLAILYFDNSLILYVDLFRVYKMYFVLLVFIILPPTIQQKFIIQLYNIVIIYIIMTFIFSLFQKFLGINIITEIFARGNHINYISLEPFGFIGTPTQAGFYALLMMLILHLFKKHNVYFYLSYINLVMHGNKMTLFLGTLFIIFLIIRSNKRNFFILLPIVLAFFIPMMLEIIHKIELNMNGELLWSSITWRLHVYGYLGEIYNTNILQTILLGYPVKKDWLGSFDSQYVLLTLRYGIVLFLMYYIFMFKIIKSYYRTTTYNFLVFFISIIGLTMYNTYDNRSSLIFSILLVVYIYIEMYKRNIKLKKVYSNGEV